MSRSANLPTFKEPNWASNPNAFAGEMVAALNTSKLVRLPCMEIIVIVRRRLVIQSIVDIPIQYFEGSTGRKEGRKGVISIRVPV